MAWKRFLRGLVVVASFSLMTAACGSDDAEPAPEPGGGGSNATAADPASITGTIRLYSYSDGFDPEYMETFFETYPNIQLETAGFGSNEEAVAKIQAGFEADVVNSCVDEATLEMVNKGMYQPLDTSRLEHWDDIWPGMKELPGVVVDGETFIVPVDAGTAGIMYNADEITTPPDSWTDLFDPQYAGRASMENLAITALDVGALANGIANPLEMTPEQLEQVKHYLIDNRGQFRTFWHGEADVKAQFKAGEIVIASGYPGIAKDLREKDGVNVQFAAAKEGQMLWTCGYGISPDIADENLDAAYALLNWYTSLPPQIYAATNWSYLTSNKGIIEAVPAKVVEEASLDSLFTLENAIPASPPDDYASWVAAWTEVKAS
ncbi:MAG: ABC transporter substrate-binding protein [Actinomycetota bacterium]